MNICKSYKRVNYEPKYLDELAYELMKFHKKVDTNYFSESNSLKTFSQKIEFFKARTKELVESCQHNTVVIDDGTGKICGFYCFRIKDGICYNPFIFKSESFRYDKMTLKGSLKSFDGMKKLGFNEIHTIIDRKDPERYLKFLHRYYNITVKMGDPIRVIFHI
jgi:hypothetical protein